jgi:hypothetical protein
MQGFAEISMKLPVSVFDTDSWNSRREFSAALQRADRL